MNLELKKIISQLWSTCKHTFPPASEIYKFSTSDGALPDDQSNTPPPRSDDPAADNRTPWNPPTK